MTPVDASTGQTLLYKRGWKVFMLLAGLGALVGGFFCARYGLQDPIRGQRVLGWLGAILFGGMGIVSVWIGLVSFWVRIHADGRFEAPGWAGRAVLDNLRSYEGFRVFSHNGITSVILVKNGKRGSVLPLSLLQDPMVLAEWLESHLPDLDMADLERERQVLIAQHTSDQDDPGEVLPRLQSLDRIAWWWVALAGPGCAIARARFQSMYDTWSWLIIDVGLALLLLTSAEIGRYRHLVTLDQKRLQHRPSGFVLLRLLYGMMIPVMWQRAFDDDFFSSGRLTFSLLVAVGLTWMPGAPDIRPRDRLILLPMMMIGAMLLPDAINVGLAPRSIHTFHTAHVTEVRSHGTKESHVTWRYDEPVNGHEGGTWSRDYDPPMVGTRFRVELARGALGWHWHVANHFDPAPAAIAPTSL